MKSITTSILVVIVIFLSISLENANGVSREVATIFAEVIHRVNSVPLDDIPIAQYIFRFANQTCMKEELRIEKNHTIITDKLINWSSDGARKILEALWLAAPLCYDGFDSDVEEDFVKLQSWMKNEDFKENLNCFKYKLEVLDSSSTLLADFDKRSVTENPSAKTACDDYLKIFFENNLKLTLESYKSEMKALAIKSCNEQTFINASERRKNLLKIVIVGNAERVPVKYLKNTKKDYLASQKELGRAMKNCILDDLKSEI
jgi:hypothetical protein